MRDRYTLEEDRKLVALVNGYRSKQGQQIHWDQIPVGKYWRTRNSLVSRWNRTLKHRVVIQDGKYVLPSTLFDAVEKPKSKSITIPPRKRRVTKKSFLWGLYTVTREE